MVSDPPTESGDEGTDARVSRTFTGFSKWTLGVIGAGFPVLVLVVRAFLLAGGDPLVASEVLRFVDPIAYLATVFLVELRTGLLIATFAAYRLLVIAFGDSRGASKAFPLPVYLTVQAICIAANFVTDSTADFGWILFLVVVVAIGASDALPRRETHVSAPAPSIRARLMTAVPLVGIGVYVVVAVLVLVATPYPAPEAFRVEPESTAPTAAGPSPVGPSAGPDSSADAGPTAAPNSSGKRGWGYVLGTDDTSTTILYADGRLERIPNDWVKERAICPESVVFPKSDITTHRSRYQRWFVHRSSPVPSICTEAGKPPNF